MTLQAHVQVSAQRQVKDLAETILVHRIVPQHGGDLWRKRVHVPLDSLRGVKPNQQSKQPVISFVSPLISVRHSVKVKFGLEAGIKVRSVTAGEIPIILHAADAGVQREVMAYAVDAVRSGDVQRRNRVVELWRDAGGIGGVGLPVRRAMTW
ncbi:uncharacterized protein SPPG_08967 [Spizellomyces punctatus DAOM BR117]|uniref:Uncharacterized protein n=1 Tax=Spizellomyces punctatus (strain DAOM BR117) TaxID=645134 RepID=A0A0L0HPU5_SPIPD|nr:uncharacterized protein SPPG_08967 [Spizellomyces punctatus DAOM BR117]KND02829.1 hypothetical protein SPPG_08967 [Spizellomyces punctatus DAOM BR117]|eukprot:XP_016610868.1 hypothetical protein SPPG_08967 [Spizellomyces punctatus DAOM BR117]